MTKDLTNGRPMKLLLQFGVPILLGLLFQQLYNAVDTAIVGKFLGGNALAAVGLVIGGVYLLFGGLIPLLAQSLAKKKTYLYQKQRILWVNSVIFRMKKNYRTYAMVCVLLLCSVTALATSFAMKGRYDSIIQFENTYTFQLLSPRDDLGQQAEAVIGEGNDIAAKSQIPILCLDSSLVESRYYDNQYAILS